MFLPLLFFPDTKYNVACVLFYYFCLLFLSFIHFSLVLFPLFLCFFLPKYISYFLFFYYFPVTDLSLAIFLLFLYLLSHTYLSSFLLSRPPRNVSLPPSARQHRGRRLQRNMQKNAREEGLRKRITYTRQASDKGRILRRFRLVQQIFPEAAKEMSLVPARMVFTSLLKKFCQSITGLIKLPLEPLI